MASEGSKTSYPKHLIKVLLLEGIHQSAVNAFQREQFQVESISKSPSDEELKKLIADAHIVGIRSKTKLTAEILKEAKRLLAVGCFCIGTDQVDLEEAQKHGFPVFNSPFSNSRSVAELTLGQIIALSRKLGDKNKELHNGVWNKTATGCHEIRGKTLGIIGYGHIGSQLSILAESMGMNVIFYDVLEVLPLGNATPHHSLESVLKEADFVTLHVPETEITRNMISTPQLAMMKKGSYLLNASRGTVVDIPALKASLDSKHLSGAYLDVYPSEPSANGEPFESILRNTPNVILTPHIGGSTEEAQEAIGREVSGYLIRYINSGRTSSAVNFPAIELPVRKDTHRILNIHHNRPGVLRDINTILSRYNVSAQILGTKPHIGYIIIDVDQETSHEVKKLIQELPSNIKTRNALCSSDFASGTTSAPMV